MHATCQTPGPTEGLQAQLDTEFRVRHDRISSGRVGMRVKGLEIRIVHATTGEPFGAVRRSDRTGC